MIVKQRGLGQSNRKELTRTEGGRT